MECELCGKETDELFEVIIEGSLLKVCKECAKFGKVKKEVKRSRFGFKKAELEEVREVELIVSPEAGKIIRELRQREGLTREEFAKKYNISERLIERLEKGEHIDVKDAQRLEKIFKVKLTEEVVLHYDPKEKKSEEEVLTVGDIIKIVHK